MDFDYFQIIRYKLQKRIRRLNSVSSNLFHYGIMQFYNFLEKNEILMNVINALIARWPNLNNELEALYKFKNGIFFDNEEENAAAGFLVLKKSVESQEDRFEIRIGFLYHITKSDEAIEHYKEMFIEPLYEYIDEHLDDSRNLLNLLVRYKRSIEWFKKDNLLKIYNDNKETGEVLLANNLYEYLYDQGIDFYIEPKTDTGRIDLISSQIGEERLLIDAKIFNPENGQGKSYLIKGFNQILTYEIEYNESIGYLVIYQTGGNNLALELENKYNKIGYIQHKNKTTFFIIIDLRDLPSASKRGKLETITINEDEFITILDE